MTLPTSTRVTDPYETDGVQRDFEFDFPAFYNADTGHYGIEVRRLTALDYEVIDKSLYDIFLNDEDKSGYIRFHVAPMAGDDIYIAGDTTRSQQLNLINYGRYSAQSIEKAFDLIVALIQEFVSKVDEETRQRILADQALRDFLLIKFNQFTAEVTTKIDKHIGDINGFMSSLIPMFVCIMRKEIANYAETGMMQVINDFMDTEIEPLIAEKVNSYLEQTDFAGAVNQIVAPIAEYVPLPFESQKTYKVNQRVTLSNGDVVKSTVAGNTVDPNADMAGWVKVNSASQIFDIGGKNQQEVNDLNLHVTKNERMFGVVGAGDETAKLSLALQERSISLVSNQINTSARITTTSKNIDGKGAKINSSGAVIPILTAQNDGFKLSNIEVDANGGGQLDAGLIVVSASKDFLIEDVVLRNGGTVNGANPKGVNAIGVATDSYPTGGRATGNLSRIFTYNFTKAPINWTTYAEEGTLSFSKFENNVGNGYCPAIQVNGGKRFKSVFNFVKGTEGAGTTIGTVGATPPLAAKEVLSFGNSYYDVGALGLANAEKYCIQIAQNFGATDTRDFVISHEYLTNAEGFLRSTGGVDNVYALGNISRDTGICYSLANAVGHYFRDQILFNYNKNNLSTIGAWIMNNCSDIVIRGGKVSSTGATSYLVSSTAGTNTGIDISDVKILNEQIGILANTHYQYFRNSRIRVSREFTVANNTTKSLHLSALLAGRSVKVDLAISAVSGTSFVDGRVQVIATSTDGTTCTILNNTIVKDAKSAGANSMVVDTTGPNLRIQWTNNLGASVTLLCEYDIYIY